MRVIIRDLREVPHTGGEVVVGKDLSRKEAEAMLKRFIKLKWDERRPGVYTIDHVAVCIEVDK